MGISISQISNNQQFATWFTRTNQMISLFGSNVVTQDSSAAGSLSSGNVQVNGNFYASNSYVGLGLFGGSAATPANLTIYTNTIFTFSATPFFELFANSSAANVNFIVNTINFGVANLQGNATFTGNVTFAGNASFNSNAVMGTGSSLKIGGNLTINSTVLSIGNSTVNVVINSTFSGVAGLTNVNFGNSTVNATMNSTVIDLTSINSTANSSLSINSSYIALGNSTVNVSINSTFFAGTANNAEYLAGQPASFYGGGVGGSFNPAVYAGISNATTLTAGSNTQTNTAVFAWSGSNTAVVALGNSGMGVAAYSNGNTALLVQSNVGNALVVQNATSNFLTVYANGLTNFSTPIQANQVLLVANGGLINAYSGNANALGIAYGLSTKGTAVLGWNLSNSSGELDLVISGNPSNGGFTIWNWTANVLSPLFSVNTTYLALPGLMVNTTTFAVNGNYSINVGSNSAINSSTLFFGNGTQNFLITSNLMQVANLNGNTSITPESTYILGGIISGNITMNASSLFVGNSTSNNIFTQGGVTILGGIASGNTSLNATALFIGNSTVNISINSSSYGLGNSTVYTQGNSTTDQWIGTVSNITVNNIQISVGSNVLLNTTSMLIGNTTVNTIFQNSGLTIYGGIPSGNVDINPTSIFFGNSTVNATVNSTFFSGVANSSEYLGGNPPAYFSNTGAPIFTTSMAVGSSVIANTSSLLIGNSTVNTVFQNSGLSILGGITSGNVTMNGSALFIGNSTVNVTINSTFSTLSSLANLTIGNTTLTNNSIISPNVFVNTSIFFGNSLGNGFINSTTFSVGNSIASANLQATSLVLFSGSNTGLVNTIGFFPGNSLFTGAYQGNNITLTDLTLDNVTTINTTAIQVAGVTMPTHSQRRNRIINGTFLFDQRHEGAKVFANSTSGNFTFPADRFGLWTTNTTTFLVTGQNLQNSTSGFLSTNNYIGVESVNTHTLIANDIYSIRTSVEGPNFLDAQWGTSGAQTFTLSFQAFSTLTGTYGLTFNSANADSNGQVAYYATNFNISAANTWTNVVITIPGCNGTIANSSYFPKTPGVSAVEITWYLDVGTGGVVGTTGQWANNSNNFLAQAIAGQVHFLGTNNAFFGLQNVQFEPGSVQTSLEFHTYREELEECQRYFEKSYNTGLPVGYSYGNANGQGVSLFPTIQFGDGSEGLTSMLQFSTKKAISPNVVVYSINGTAGFYGGQNSTGAIKNDPQSDLGIQTYMSCIQVQSTNTSVGYAWFDYAANSEIL